MPSYEFGGTLFRTPREMCRSIAEDWMTAGGHNPHRDIRKSLSDSDEQLADECISGWGLNQPPEDAWPNQAPTWMEQRGVDRADIIAAFADFRRAFTKRG